MALWLCGLVLMSAPLSELLIHVIQLLECSIERAKHTVNMVDFCESEYNECEETGTDSGGEVKFYSDEENGGGYLSSGSDYTGKFGDDFGRTNHVNAIR